MVNETIEMTVAQWIGIPDHPRQRDTERRAKADSGRHLHEYKSIHKHVHAVKYNGKLYKADGHSRAFLWDSGKLRHPPGGMVSVTVSFAKTEREFLEVYEWFDSSYAVKTGRDQLFGAVKECGLDIRSGLLLTFGWSTQLKRADKYKHSNIYDTVAEWKDVIAGLDGMGLTSKHFPQLIGLMLTAIRRDGVITATKFFVPVFKGEGVQDARGKDGVRAACEFLEDKKSKGAMSGYENWDDIDCKVWSAYEQYKAGRFIRPKSKLQPSKVFLELVSSPD